MTAQLYEYEERVPFCIKCGSSVDEIGCSYECDSDYGIGERPNDTYVFRVYRVTKTLIAEEQPK